MLAKCYPAVTLRHPSPAQLVHQRWQDAAAVSLIPQSVKYDEADGVDL